MLSGTVGGLLLQCGGLAVALVMGAFPRLTLLALGAVPRLVSLLATYETFVVAVTTIPLRFHDTTRNSLVTRKGSNRQPGYDLEALHKRRYVLFPINENQPHLRCCVTADFKTGGVACELAFIIGFIGGTIRAMCTPGRDEDLQRECYDGHHQMHGLAWQSVVFADGIIGDVHVETGRRHDSYLLSQSNSTTGLQQCKRGIPCNATSTVMPRIPSCLTSTADQRRNPQPRSKVVQQKSFEGQDLC